MQACTELEAELAELRAAYEQYFLGNERVPPQKQHEAFKKALTRLKGQFVRQTAVKFRIESISQKLLTYERLWDRTLKEIEAGTYKRDLAKLKRKAERRQKRKEDAADVDFDVDEDLDLSDLDADDDLASALAEAEAAVSKPPALPVIAPVAPVIAPVVAPAAARPVPPSVTAVKPGPGTGVSPQLAPPTGTPRVAAPGGGPTPAGGVKPATTAVVSALPRITAAAGTPSSPRSSSAISSAGSQPPRPVAATAPKAAPQPPKPVAADGGLSDQKIKAIYDAYLMAKKRCGEDTRSVTFDSVSSSLRKQVPELMRQHNARSVEFKVVIKDGKAILRALPKE